MYKEDMSYAGPNSSIVTTSTTISSNDPTSTGEAFKPSLLPDENIIWSRNQTKGIIHRHVISREWITNYRIIQCSPYLSQIDLSNLQDVIILNQFNQSNSSFSGYGSSARGSRFMSGNSKSISMHIGDIAFLVNNRPIVIFSQIQDPNSIVKLVKTLMGVWL
jgi:hypothetical protein